MTVVSIPALDKLTAISWPCNRRERPDVRREGGREWKDSPTELDLENSVILDTANTQLPTGNSFFYSWWVFSGMLQRSPGEANKCWIFHRSTGTATKLEILLACVIREHWQDSSWLIILRPPASLHISFLETYYLCRDWVRSDQESVIPKVIYPILIPKRTNIFLFLDPAFLLIFLNQYLRMLTGWTIWKFPSCFTLSSQCLTYQFKVGMEPIYHFFIPSSFFIFLGSSSSFPTWQKGAHSATMTWNFLFRAASLRKASTVREKPMVMMTSLEWMCSRAWAAMFSVVPSARTVSLAREMWNCHATT